MAAMTAFNSRMRCGERYATVKRSSGFDGTERRRKLLMDYHRVVRRQEPPTSRPSGALRRIGESWCGERARLELVASPHVWQAPVLKLEGHAQNRLPKELLS